MAKKTICPITRQQFRSAAKAIKIVIDGQERQAAPREFSTGSLGWYLNEKIHIEIAGVSVPVQLGFNLTVVGSKELPDDSPSAPAAASAES